jgi:hypothetical protein
MVVGCARNSSGRLQPPTPEDCPGDVWALIQQCTSGKTTERPTAKVQASCQRDAWLQLVLLASLALQLNLSHLCQVQAATQPLCWTCSHGPLESRIYVVMLTNPKRLPAYA